MTLKMRLLVVDEVVRLIEEDMDMDMNMNVCVGVGVGMGVVELATLIGNGLLMLLKMVTTTMNSLLFLAFRIKRLEASYVYGWRKVVYRLPEAEAHNLKLTDDMQAFNRDFVLQLPFTTIAALVRNWRFASQTRQFQTQP